MVQKKKDPEGITAQRTPTVPSSAHILNGRSRTPCGTMPPHARGIFKKRTRRLLLCSSSFRDVCESQANSATVFVNQDDAQPRDVGELLLTLVS